MKRQQSIIRPFKSSYEGEQPRVQISLSQLSPSDLNNSKLNKSLLFKSQNISKHYKYVKYDLQGNTQLIDEPQTLSEGFSYQKVHLQENGSQILGQNIDWYKDIKKLQSSINTKQTIVMKSMNKLWEKNFRPHFFDWIEQTKGKTFQYHTYQIPQCLYELDHLSPNHTKFLFLTQNYSNNGLYQIILNEDGRCRLVTVSDTVPVYDQSNQHLWGIEEPWKMILVKVWACLNHGYDNILKNHQSFKFLEYFTGNNWKYYNLEIEGSRWINHFKELLDISYIVLQTKNCQTIQKMGLVSDSAAYNIVSIRSDPQRGEQIEIKSRFKHKWKGKLSMINYDRKLWKEEGKQFRLEKNFLMTKDEFFKVFCCAYITSLSKSNSHVTDYVQIRIPKNSKNAVYLNFQIKKKGFMDFSFIQSHRNKILVQGQEVRIDAQKYKTQAGKKQSSKSRYLKCKYMLIRSLKGSNQVLQSKLSRIKSKNEISLTRRSQYQAYQVEYLRGYNKGEAHFMIMEPGNYYFRLKSQAVDQDAVYYLNYCCSEKVNISQEIILADEQQDLLQNCILSLLPACAQNKLKSCTVYSGNKFNDMGYGFIVIENTTHQLKQPHNISFKIYIHQLQLQGYKLKGKQYQQPNKSSIVLQIQPQAYLVLILKRINDNDPTLPYVWPPKSILFYDTNKSKQQ